MDAGVRIRDIENERERRRAARTLIGEYHEAELRKLLDHVRKGFRQLDAGEIDPFDLDELIHRYKRSAQKLWSFCGSSGSAWEAAAITIESLREQGEEEPDWWDASQRRRGITSITEVLGAAETGRRYNPSADRSFDAGH
ncbi:MAG: hypothetical protein ACR2JH_04515 [Solirubrobacteraceae bacterium]